MYACLIVYIRLYVCKYVWKICMLFRGGSKYHFSAC